MAAYTYMDYAVAFAILLVIIEFCRRFVFTAFELDRGFLYAMAPVVLFAISIRVLVDAGVYEKSKLWNVTPGVYVLGVVFGLLEITAGKLVERHRGVEYWKTSIALGLPVAGYYFTKLLLRMERPLNSIQPIALALLLTLGIYLLSSLFESWQVFRRSESIAVIYAHMLDGSATFIGIDRYGFSEEHIIPELLIKKAGTAFVMIPVKILIVLAALYLLHQWSEGEEGSDLYYKMLIFVFFILGFGPGVRDSLLLGL